MNKSYYYGNQDQIMGVEEYRLVEGKADNMRMMHIRNGLGLEVTVCPDRCLDITRVTFKGDNMGYFSPCGNVSPSYYDGVGNGMVDSFTGGFLTTCGLNNAGVACEDNGEVLPLHGNISNQPAYHSYWIEEENDFSIYAKIIKGGLFLGKMELDRKISISKNSNKIKVEDSIKNCGEKEAPCMILYHMNMGYPLLTEKSILEIPSVSRIGRDEFAASDIENWNKIEAPTDYMQEKCYFHTFDKNGFARIYNNDIKKGVEISFDADELKYFTQWKMMGKYDYVLGLEPGNCLPNGRKESREKGQLKILKGGETVNYSIEINFVEE